MASLLQTSSSFILCFFQLTLFAPKLFNSSKYVFLLDNSKFTAINFNSKSPIIRIRPGNHQTLANTGIGIIGVAYGDIPAMASDQNFAKGWLSSNVLPFYPASNIIVINVGNEVMSSNDQNLMTNLLPEMQNLQNALNEASIGGKIWVSTIHSMAVLKQSDPPSSGSFDPNIGDLLKGLLEFNKATGSPFAINPYPFFFFCLFHPNSGRVDAGTKIKYTNVFDAPVDAIRSALNALGFKEVEIVIAETGWPYKGDSEEIGPSMENAKAYNGNLIAHLRSMVGTPLMPGKSVDTYLFAMYDEDLKPGPTFERSFGLFKPDLTMTYDIGLSKANSQIKKITTRTQLSYFSILLVPTPKTPVHPRQKHPKNSGDSLARSIPKSPVTPSPYQMPKTPVTPSSNSTLETLAIPSLVPTPKATVTSVSPKTDTSVKAGVSDAQLQGNINLGMLVLIQILWYLILHMQ
ncbi:unnamed protein product [Withania somnifera]